MQAYTFEQVPADIIAWNTCRKVRIKPFLFTRESTVYPDTYSMSVTMKCVCVHICKLLLTPFCLFVPAIPHWIT